MRVMAGSGDDHSQTDYEDQDIADRSPSLSPEELDTVRPPQMTEARQTSQTRSTESRSTQAADTKRPSGGRISFRLAWLVAWLALGAGLLFHGFGGHTSDLEQPALASTTHAPRLQLTKPIEQVRVGDRVAFADNPAEPFDDSLGREVNPATWQQIELRLDGQSKQRGDVVLLRPKWWLDARLKQNGPRLTLSVPEVGLSGDMEVVAVKPYPSIHPGRGRVVIGTFAHWAAETIELSLRGLDHPIRCTPNHATWSHDRQRFVEAQDLRLGERVQGTDRFHRVTRIVRINEPIQVYNLEIHGQHVYQVSSLGVLVHNAGPGGSSPLENDLKFHEDQLESLEGIREGQRGEEWKHAGDQDYEDWIEEFEDDIEKTRDWIEFLNGAIDDMPE